jgi:hypothetical protein
MKAEKPQETLERRVQRLEVVTTMFVVCILVLLFMIVVKP